MERRTAALVAAALLATACRAPDASPSRPELPEDEASPAARSIPSPPTPATPAPSNRPVRLGAWTPARSADWLDTIPPAVRVDTNLPADEDPAEPVGVSATFCSEEAFTVGGLVDRRVAGASGPEHGEARDLRLFRDDRAARAFVERAVTTVTACPEEVVGGTTRQHSLLRSGLVGDEAFTVVQTYADADGTDLPGASWWEVVRVGNAVLLTGTSGEWVPGSLATPIENHVMDVAPVAVPLCVFASGGCGVRRAPAVLGPDGVMGLRLGMTVAEVRATGLASSRPGSAHDGWPPGCHVLGLGRIDRSGRVSPTQGLEQVLATRGMVTPEGVRVGSTRDDARRAWPDAHVGRRSLVRVPTADGGAVYELTLSVRLVDSIALELPEQDCEI